MDPLFLACSHFRRRKFDECIKICTSLLDKNQYDQSAWTLKMRALTEQVYVDEVEMDEDGIAELLDENVLAQVTGSNLLNTEAILMHTTKLIAKTCVCAHTLLR